MKQFYRKNGDGEYYSVFKDEGNFKVGIYTATANSPFWTIEIYDFNFDSLVVAERVAEMMCNAYDDGYNDGQVNML